MPTRIDPRELARLHREHPDLSQRELADRTGLSQATVSRLLRDEGDLPDPTDEDDPVDALDEDEDDEPFGPETELALTVVADLESQIRQLAKTARAAEGRNQFAAAVAARKLAAKLRVDLEAAREAERRAKPAARSADPDEALLDAFVELVGIVPDVAFERVEDAVARRRRRAAERERDGG